MKHRPILRILAFSAALCAEAFAQTAGQDVKNAGNDTKNAAKSTGKAVKRTAKTTGRKIKHGTHHAAQSVANKTK